MAGTIEITDRANTPVVSIVCTTYNHEEYIKDALEGFIAQKTTFPFEVIVHDDASTDRTGDIVKWYADRYPDLIVPILQEENQRLKGLSAFRDCAMPHAKGEYIALCEGDDFWISPYKLQRQYEALAHCPQCALCVHNALIADYGHNLLYLSEPDDGDRMKTMADIVIEGGGRLNPTASFFFKKDAFNPEVIGPVGDHFYLMALAKAGGAIWLSTPMSVYRLMAKGSWSVRHSNAGSQARLRYHERYIHALEEMDSLTEYRFADAFAVREQMHRLLLHAETVEEDYCAGKIGIKTLCLQSPQLKTIAKGFLRRHAPIFLESKIGRFMTLLSCKKTKTLVLPSASTFPDWARPLRETDIVDEPEK